MLFKEIIGHSELKQRFINDTREGKVSHAHLLLGDLGYGGLPLTLAFVQYLMCENRQETDSCGTCSSCNKMEKMQHPDVHFSFPTVQAETKTSDVQFPLWKSLVKENPYLSLNEWILKSDDKGRAPIISVHQSVEIIKKLTLKSFEGGYKVSVIWLAEEMNDACSNKLLKIIEEPPNKTVFILIAASEENILPTILSRTQITKVKQLNGAEMMEFLQKRSISQDLAESISSRSEGSISLALELLEAGGAENTNFTRFVNLMRFSYSKDVMSMMKWAEEIGAIGREEQKHFIKYSLYMIRQSLMQNYTQGKLMRTSTKETEFLSKFARFITGNNVKEFTKLFDESHYYVERNANSKILFTNITFEVMRYIRRA